jgi:hypothetical protein
MEDVVRIHFDNGEMIFLNYSYNPVVIDGYTVSAVDYLVIERGGGTR